MFSPQGFLRNLFKNAYINIINIHTYMYDKTFELFIVYHETTCFISSLLIHCVRFAL